jgi:hypothetical protein
MAMSSDRLIKQEIFNKVGDVRPDLKLRVFPDTSNQDQKRFSEGGLTFGFNGVSYGSCDAAWVTAGVWIDRFDNSNQNPRPVLALEGTDGLNRGNTGNAQYQRFHHALGSVRNGVPSVYYLRRGANIIRPELHGMAYFATKIEGTPYLVTDDLVVVSEILKNFGNQKQFDLSTSKLINASRHIYEEWFKRNFGSIEKFAEKRSTILWNGYAIKHSARSARNFTDGSQRAGHIAVGEMYLSKYLLPKFPVLYLWPRFSRNEITDLDRRKGHDKEWRLLRNEPGVTLITRDELVGLPSKLDHDLAALRDTPLKGKPYTRYKEIAALIETGLRHGSIGVDLEFDDSAVTLDRS